MFRPKYKKGNIITAAYQNEFDVLVHGCNAFTTMGAGIAKQIKAEWPLVYQADLQTVKGDRSKLGKYTYANIKELNLTVINAYTQYTYNDPDDMLYLDAVRSCFRLIANDFNGKRIAMPRIGAGLAGGCWHTIEAILCQEMINQDVTIYIL